MLLNYRLCISQNSYKTIPIVMIHGLFGSLSNLRTLATSLAQYCDIIQIDLRNHGRSPHDPVMDYHVMAQDILNLLNHLSIKKCIVLGHSIGGKVAMTLGILAYQRIDKLIVIDIAPKKYDLHKHQNIFSAINYINTIKIQDKQHIISVMQKNCIEPHIILFLLKSFQQGKWTFNFDAIMRNYNNINDWTTHQMCCKSSLFIRGELSSYIKEAYVKDIYHQFPFANVTTIPNARHWVHYDKPTHVLNNIKKFIFNTA